ncbi:MAG: XdhC family protein [Anaerolineae bacterium]
MRELLPQLTRWHADRRSMALATVVQTWGSAPRRIGSNMVITDHGEVAGSVSGGCVENAVVESALDAINTDRAQLLHFDVSDASAWRVGLACGGSIDIFVRPLGSAVFNSLRDAWLDGRTTISATLIRGPQERVGEQILIRNAALVDGQLDQEWKRSALALASEAVIQGTSRCVRLSQSEEVFLEVIAPPPTLIAVGGVHIAVALLSLAKMLDYRTVMIDPRQAWGNAQRFPDVDELMRSWPDDALRQVPLDRSSAVVTLTHDPKLDDPALKVALTSPAFYVGALGSKSTQLARRERLLGAGLAPSQLDRLHAPVGLDIGAQTPEEIALAIMAQIVQSYRKSRSVQAAAGMAVPASV